MKLPKTYYQDITKQIENAGIPLAHFSFVKRKGWVYVHNNSNDEFFSFFRKKSVEISPEEHKWEHKETFTLKTSNEKTLSTENWETVLAHFCEWLKRP